MKQETITESNTQIDGNVSWMMDYLLISFKAIPWKLHDNWQELKNGRHFDPFWATKTQIEFLVTRTNLRFTEYSSLLQDCPQDLKSNLKNIKIGQHTKMKTKIWVSQK